MICISLMITATEHLFNVSIGYLHIVFREMSILKNRKVIRKFHGEQNIKIFNADSLCPFTWPFLPGPSPSGALKITLNKWIVELVSGFVS